MEEFKQTEKRVFWIVLLLIQALAWVFKLGVSVQLLVNSVCCVALGSLYSIHLKKGKRVKVASDDEESLSVQDALKFPFAASATLLVLYILFNNVNTNLLVYLFKVCFGFMGASTIGSFLAPRVAQMLPQIPNTHIYKNKLKILGQEIDADINVHNLIAYTVGGIIGALYVITGHWTLNNVLGVCFTIVGIMLLKVSKFSIVLLLLWLLFFYDIFWVFGSDVMVTVAKKFDVPIKLQFPLGEGKFSILGLGDMVIPGILTALALKFDVDNGLEQKQDGKLQFKTPVFNSVMVGYALGIVATFAGMSLMNHAQPALLYLVPTCSLGLIFALVKDKKLKKAWTYEAEISDKTKET